MLRGEASRSVLSIEGIGSNAFCLTKGVGSLDALPPCWGPAGGIRTAKAQGMYARPTPASSNLTLILLNRDGVQERIEVVDAAGRRIDAIDITPSEAGNLHIAIDVVDYPPGLYLVRTTTGHPASTTIVRRED